jgi:uncharacterized membrane protein YagU involved in acid resistance
MFLARTGFRRNAFSTIAKAGLVAGLLDITAAFINYRISTGKNPVRVLEFIASGVFGKSAFAGDATMALLGFVFHMTIALIFAVLFFLLCCKISWLYKDRWTAGIVYGILVWIIMNLLVVPQSNTPPIPFTPAKALLAVGILIVCVGWPVAFIIGHYFRQGDTDQGKEIL